MCCFSQPVEHVGGTRIFARPLLEGRQLLVYSMHLRARSDVAMVLPLPVPPGSAEEAVRFVDFSSATRFFDDVEALFPFAISGDLMFQPSRQAPTLRVHAVGAFEASFVPRPADFARLDRRFRLPDRVWSALPEYADWGFAVFKLRGSPRPTLTERAIDFVTGLLERDVSPPEDGGDSAHHPMALTFPRRHHARLFFPTVHVHDGVVHPTARFDHDFFCQVDGEDRVEGWTASPDVVGAAAPRPSHVHLALDRRVHRQRYAGELPNRDLWVPSSVT